MTDLDSAGDAASVQMRASRSDLSIANSSPRLESNATTSTACIADVPPLRRDLSSELLCPLCDQLFDRPVMVTCGHSYCEPCIERHTRNTRDCVICKHDVGPLQSMIPSITLDNMVRKLKNQEQVETSSYEDLFICDEKMKEDSKVCRTPSQRSQKRRLFFSIAGPTICSSPLTPHRRRPLSPSARPTKSSLKNLPDTLCDDIVAADRSAISLKSDEIVAGNLFRRNGFGRRSERFTSATQAKSDTFEEDETKTKGDDAADGKLKRNSFFRRSLNAFRSRTSTRRRSFLSHNSILNNAQIPEEEEEEDENGEVLIHEPEGGVPTLLNETPKTKQAKSLWRRLFMSKKSKIGAAKLPTTTCNTVQLLNHEKLVDNNSAPPITFVRLENQHDDPEGHENWLTGSYALGYYTGIGRKFERIGRGSEITLVVFGHGQSGKTTLVRTIRKLFLEGTDHIRVIPIAQRYKLAGIGVMPFPEGDNRLPHIVSLVINNAPDEEFVLDIIDPEYDNANLPQAYMDACDAALFLIDARNCASLLSAHQIQRNLKTAEHSHVQCEMVMNIPSEESGQPRLLSAQVCETMAKKATLREICVEQLEKSVVEEMLLSICSRVRTARRPSNSSV